jgi:replicative DNA helicase
MNTKVRLAAAPAGNSFSKYGKSFQEKIFQGMVTDKDWAAQMHEVMNPEYFDLKYLKYLTKNYFSYYDKYRCFPTMQLLIQIIREDLQNDTADQMLRDQIIAFLQRMRMNQHPEDLPYVKDQSLQFCKRQAFKEALTQAVELVQGEQFEQVVDLMRTAVSVGMPQSIGHEFFEDLEARFQEISRITTPTGLPELDCKDVLDGGLGRGELGVVVAPTGVGKCVEGHTYVCVRYSAIVIDGLIYLPYEKVKTARGEIYAKDIIETDELRIEKRVIEQELQIKDLFQILNKFETKENCEYVSSETIEVATPYGYKKIEGYMTTEKLSKVIIETETGRKLIAAAKHRVFDEHHGWRFLSEMEIGNRVITRSGPESVVNITEDLEEEYLYDIQVEDVHQFWTNDILSHNSHWLVNMGAEALKIGKTVVHYTFELSETLTGKRYDANLTNISVSDLFERKDEVIQNYEDNEYGSLIIKYYPCRSASVNTIRNHLEKLKLRNYTPSVVIIDYADVMKSTRAYDALRLELQLIYEELRQMAADFDIPVWTASQSNRSGASADFVGLENMGESYGKAQVSDVVLGLSRKPEEKASGYARLFVAKNRAGIDGINLRLKIDTATSRFSSLSPDEMETYEMLTDPKKRMKEMWDQVKVAKKELSYE